jgi:hypothetical protein
MLVESKRWLDQIHKQGYAVIPGVLNAASVDALLDEFSKISLPRSRAGLRHAMKLPVVADVARNSQLMEIACGVLGAQAFPFRATLFDKSPNSNWLVVWHQDTALPLQERRDVPGWGPWSVKDGIVYAHAPASAIEQVLALRLHFDDSTAHNGPLRVLSGTHTLGVLSDEQLHDLAVKIPEMECLVPRGGVLAMRPLIVHASSKSRAEMPRRVLHIEYVRARTFPGSLELAIA